MVLKTKFDQVKEDLITQLQNITYKNGDLSDIGNEIGLVIGKHIEDKFAGEWSKEALKHGTH